MKAGARRARQEILDRVAKTEVAVVPPAMEEVVRRYGDGESLQVLAKELGIRDEALRQRVRTWVLTGQGDEAYRDLVTRALAARVVEADEKLEAADDSVEVNKYAHVARFARVDFERRRPELYGAKPVQVNVAAVSVDSALVGTMGELLATVAAAHGPRTLEHDGSDTVTVDGDER